MFLELDLATILLEIANFLVLTALLYYFLFRPVLQRVEERAAEKQRLIEKAREDRQQAAEMRAEVEAHLEALDDRVSDILEEARNRIETERRQVMDAVRREANDILAQARREGRQVREQQVSRFHQDLLETVMTVSRYLIRQAAPEQVHDQLLQQLNERAWEMGHKETDLLQSLRRSLGEHHPTARITTARALSAEQQRDLVRTFSAVADHAVSVDIEVDPGLAAGARVRLGDLVLENSIAGRLEALREDVLNRIEESTSG
ncbi:MAG: hypothetical protein GX597_14010 [Anaerolineaceae bacterium]|jgi:F-type H+-transporting ATPase subunit b|nr:F0F1 ATP synthase subunit delta [Anaerolineae bacterium]MDX9831329.1 F0F1 ATP synthase subunit delta [Anaerolineae bacterium]NLF12900.1 hypothetical protein [Anaerolineaceae bacterium]